MVLPRAVRRALGGKKRKSLQSMSRRDRAKYRALSGQAFRVPLKREPIRNAGKFNKNTGREIAAMRDSIDADFLLSRGEEAEQKAMAFFKGLKAHPADPDAWFNIAEYFLFWADTNPAFKGFLQQEVVKVANRVAQSNPRKAQFMLEEAGRAATDYGRILALARRIQGYLNAVPRYSGGAAQAARKSLQTMVGAPETRYTSGLSELVAHGRAFEALQLFILAGNDAGKREISTFLRAFGHDKLSPQELDTIRKNYRLRFGEDLPA